MKEADDIKRMADDIKSEVMVDADSDGNDDTRSANGYENGDVEIRQASGTQIEPLANYSNIGIETSPESISEVDEESIKDLDDKRALITRLLNTYDAQEGDYWNLIPNAFLQSFLTSDVKSFHHLKNQLGPINTDILTDSSGMLYVDETQATQTICVHPKVFQFLVEWFGLYGEPISRAIIIDNETGDKVLEKFPPYFILHNLSKTNKISNHSKPSGFFMSCVKTFQDLVDYVREHYFRLGGDQHHNSNNFRIWFLNDQRLDDYPTSVTINQFVNDITYKNLVFKNILDNKLKSQNINSLRYHLLIEVSDKNTGKYPIDAYIETSHNDLDNITIDKILSSSGHLGLINLGNTCYMNSALQCLIHIPEINYYFFFNVFQKELNKSNPLGYGGNMAQAFGSLLHKLFNYSSIFQGSNSSQSMSSISPREFKYTIGHFSSMFQGYQQQDSQEFLSWLLDALHEDLNRIYNKPYLEKPELKDDEINDLMAIKRLADISWNQYKQRNDSVIIDLFSGLYQSILVCPDCSKTSITYDPFNDLTLPLPIDKKWYHTFKIVNLDFDQVINERIMNLQVELNKASNFDDLLIYLSNFLNVPKEDIFIFEIFNNFFYQDFQTNSSKYKFIPISELINTNDDIIVYIIPHDRENNDDLIIPVINTVPEPDKSYNFNNIFGIPLFITINKNDVNSFGKVRGKLEQVVQLLTTINIDQHYSLLKQLPQKQYYQKQDFDQISPEESNESNNEDGYDSDVSLADPEISGDYGFVIKYHQDNYRFKADTNKAIHVPHIKPNVNNLPNLADQLPDLKYNYYHYPNYKREQEYVMVERETDFESKSDDTPETENQSESSQKQDDEVEIEETEEKEDIKLDQERESSPGSEQVLEQDGLEILEGSDNDRLGSLFDSVGTLNKAESNKNANVTDNNRVNNTNNHPTLINNATLLVLEWNTDVYNELFKTNNTWQNVNEIPNPELELNKEKLLAKQKSTISLYDCLDNFYQPEILGDQDLWYCPRCKDHKQATKTIKIWSTGDILTIHLKRFQMARSFSDKIDVTIDFPIEGLDMTNYIDNPDENLIYDLIAVDNHYGGLGGGHYTASVWNFRDNQWYYFNDSRVTKIDDPKDTITSAAYLLFYRKRTVNNQKFLGGDKLNELISEGKKEYEQVLSDYKQNIININDQVRLFREQEQDINLQEEEELEDAEQAEPATEETESLSSSKKSRSPLVEDESTFDKKKRLLTKDKMSPTPINNSESD